MWEKEKLLVKSNFSFSHIVFKRHVPQTRKNQGLFGKGLNRRQNLRLTQIEAFADDKSNVTQVVFDRSETLWEKKKMLDTSIFFFSHNVFKGLFPPVRQKSSLCGNGLTQILTTLKKRHFENILKKGENAGDQHFLHFQQCFQPLPKQVSNF